jgi:hypothetical protein
MYNFDDMTREDLLAIVRQQAEGLLRYGNHPPMDRCPFCNELGRVPILRLEIKEHLVDEWRRDVTMEEYELFAQKMQDSVKLR